jgi:uncharacterized membrane-anchored protein YhcB (DUF1043 family)
MGGFRKGGFLEMVEPEQKFEWPEEPAQKSFPGLGIGIGIALVLMAVIAAVILHGRPQRLQKEAAIAQLAKELDTDREALEEQRSKVVDLTQQLQMIKQAIQGGQVANRKKAVDEYNRLALQQNAERDKFTSMAAQYNAKVAKLKQME